MTDRPSDTQTQPMPGYPGPAGPPPSSNPWMFGEPARAPLSPQPRPRRRTGLAAAVIAAALVAGGGAGVGGAALWDSLHDGSGSAGTTTPTTSKVVDQGDRPAPAGSVEEVAAKVLPSVVKIEVAGAQGEGSGSGIILTSDGTILTNNHVVEVAGQGGSIRVDFNDGSHATAKILGTDPLTDTAVIKADGVSGLTPATIGKSSNLDVGESVVAIGSPFGLDSTVTSGIVSALERPVNVGSDGQGNATVYPAIQTDAAINPGNSGGALVDMAGAVVGINASIRSTTSASGEAGSIGLGFAIPIDEVMPIVDQMTKGETPTHARLGITVADASAVQGQVAPGQGGSGQGLEDGALVREVGAGSAAEKAGIESGDVITKVDDHIITGSDALIATIRSYRPGDEVTVTYVRDGTSHDVTLELDSDESQAAS